MQAGFPEMGARHTGGYLPHLESTKIGEEMNLAGLSCNPGGVGMARLDATDWKVTLTGSKNPPDTIQIGPG